MDKDKQSRPKGARKRQPLPRSFKDLTPAKHFKPHTFFYEMVWKTFLQPRRGEHCRPKFPKLKHGQVALTWIGHASFLAQFTDLNLLIDPNFANWLFVIKRLRRSGLKLDDLPPIDLLLLSHAHFDHFHRPTVRKVKAKIGIVPWGMGELVKNLGFERVIELQWWESFSHGGWKVTLTPSQHWGARTLRDTHRGYGGFLIEHQGRRLYHAGDSAYFPGFKEIGIRCPPEIAMLPIGAYYPDSFRKVHMGPDEAVKAFHDLESKFMVPMHYGTFKLAFEDLDEPVRWLRELAHTNGLKDKVKILEEGIPAVF